MNHLSEEELIEHYYGESGRKAGIDAHLRACGTCSRAYEALSRDLAGIPQVAPPARDAAYGDQVWQSLRNSLPVYSAPASKWRRLTPLRILAFATACALILAAAFIAGRQWERRREPTLAGNTPQARERVVLFVLGDHLERSERLLVELKNADDSGTIAAPLRSEAQDLLTANRLYRASATQAGDPVLAAALDHLERALVEVANGPDDLSNADLARIQKEMNTDGLLFEVRVLRSRVQAQQQGGTTRSKGVSI